MRFFKSIVSTRKAKMRKRKEEKRKSPKSQAVQETTKHRRGFEDYEKQLSGGPSRQ